MPGFLIGIVGLLHSDKCLRAAKLDPFSSESEDESHVHKRAGMRAQRARSDADKAMSNQRLNTQKVHNFEPSESLADDDEIPFDPTGHAASRNSLTLPPKTVRF